MKKSSFRPLLSVTAACLLPAAALHAQTTLQSPGGRPGESAAQPAAVPMATPMGENMTVQMSPPASLSQPFPPVTSRPLDTDRDGFQFRARAGVEHDDNVLRTNTNRQSDTILSAGVGLRLNKRIGLQRIVVDAEANRYDYRNQPLDYNTLNYAAAWYWAFGNRFEGIASADRRQFRDVSSNGLAGVVSRRTERSELFEGGYRLGAAWRVLAGLQHTESTSTDPSSWDGNPSVNSVRVGTSYEFASGSSATLRYRHGDGDYKASLGVPGFKDNEIESVLHWVATAKTSLDGRLAWIKRKHDGAPTRDFDGAVGMLNANWDATAKTRVFAGLSHDLGSYLFSTGGHLSSDRTYVGTIWRPTVQTGVTLRYEHENRKWVDVPAGSTDAGRADRFNVLAAGFDWQPLRTVSVSTQLRNERRSSSLPAFNYRANVIGLAVRLTI